MCIIYLHVKPIFASTHEQGNGLQNHLSALLNVVGLFVFFSSASFPSLSFLIKCISKLSVRMTAALVDWSLSVKAYCLGKAGLTGAAQQRSPSAQTAKDLKAGSGRKESKCTVRHDSLLKVTWSHGQRWPGEQMTPGCIMGRNGSSGDPVDEFC